MTNPVLRTPASMFAPEVDRWRDLPRRHHLARGAGILVGTAGIATLHYVTDASHLALHEIYNYLCYVPVIFAAYWYGAWGGIVAATLTAALFVPHIRSAWTGNAAYSASLYAQVVAFHVIGVTVGVLVGAQRRLAGRYRAAASSLERANRELRESQEHLRRADRLSALGEIAAGLAHEIKNPLASVKGAIEIITSRAKPESPEAEFAGIATKEIARLEGLVGEFLSYAGPHAPTFRLQDLHKIVTHVAALLHAQAEQKGVTVVSDCTGDIPLIPLDQERITQVVFNVVLNAIQATDGPGEVRVCESVERPWVVIDVTDQGAGIAPAHAERIFDPFFTTKPKGTGLGLAISQRIVEAHHGTIEVRPHVPRGSTFRIRLPLSGEAAGGV
ncbi:MAG: hypothetical protein IT180_02830 [Acidobacteria bacterium]|nr:hypothetical protein [Acidobacteriota bacterium]